MGRISSEEKIAIVEQYLSGTVSINAAAEQLEVGWQTVDDWVRRYKMRGATGLHNTISNRKYDSALKKQAVEEYLAGGASQRDICAKYDISRHAMLQEWIKWYNNHGDFKQPNIGGAIYMVKGRKTTLEERIEIVSYCIAHNKNYGKTIELYGVSYQQIHRWVKKYERDGVDALVDCRGRRKDEVSMSEVEKLRLQLKLKEAENLRLRAENELLKKLEALERGQGKV